MQLQIAPLRVRPADIIDLQSFILRDISRRSGVGPMTLSQDAARHLESYAFPDNVTELEAILERAVLQSKGQGSVIPEDVFWFASEVGRDNKHVESDGKFIISAST